MIQSFFAGNRKKLAAKLPIEHFIFSAFLNIRILDGVQQLRKSSNPSSSTNEKANL